MKGVFGAGAGKAAAQSRQFSGLSLSQDPYNSDIWTVSGTGHEAYRQFREEMDSYTVDSSGYGRGVIETIDPGLIEGIHLSTWDVDHPDQFWGQHMDGGTMDSFLEVASHIPEVKSRLDAGADLSSLMEDPVLGTCAGVYFNPDSATAPTLVKGDGFYEFQSNGRHRIIAAQKLGYSFPIRVVGEIVRK